MGACLRSAIGIAILGRYCPTIRIKTCGCGNGSKAFEFTHELAWKALKDFLEARGAVSLYGSRDATREAFATGLIEDGETWMAMIQSRNQTSHTYDEETVHRIAAAILSTYLTQFERFEKRFMELEREEEAR
jgi:nucleotidyltransferase substrate binding protein (TIGR01987 family)